MAGWPRSGSPRPPKEKGHAGGARGLGARHSLEGARPDSVRRCPRPRSLGSLVVSIVSNLKKE